jgi:protoporphyrinogen oxidase
MVAEVVILGAGLTGLSVAYHLEQNGFFDYQIFEQDDRPGGLAKSESCNGFTFDYTGHFLHLNNPEASEFITSTVGFDTFENHKRQSSIFSYGTYTNYPFQMNLKGLPTDVIIDCLKHFITRKQSIKHPINFYQWILKHFGKGLGEHFFFPYNQKLLSHPIKKIHHSWTGRFVPQTSLDELLSGALEARKNQNVGYNNFFYYPKSGGIETMIKKIQQHIKNPIKTNHRVIAVDIKARQVMFNNGHIEPYRQLITTLPLNNFLTITKTSSHKNVATATSKLLCTSVLNVNLGFNNSINLLDHWTYFPEATFPFYRIGYWHNINQRLAPAGKSAIYAELSYRQTHKQPLEKLSEQTINTLLSHLKLNRTNIIAHKNLLLHHAYVIYDQWREQNITKLLSTLAQDSVHSIGRFGAWKYASMQEAILDGKEACKTVLDILKFHNVPNITPSCHTQNQRIN